MRPITMGAFFEMFDWQHSVLLGGAVVGGVLVGIGILMESERWSTASILVLIGVTLEPIFTIGLFMYDESLGREQNTVIREQRDKIIALEKQIKEDQDVLMWQMMPRMLNNVTGCRKILGASPKGAKVKKVWLSSVSDGESFAWFISTCFSNDPQHPFPPKWELEKGAVEKLPDGASRDGVTVISNTLENWLGSPNTPAGFITKGLFEGVPLHKGINSWRDTTIPDDEVLIAIGPKLP
jgi:hypothetical protein